MTTFKITISDKKGKSITRELKEKDANPLLGLQLGAEVDAAIVGQPGKMKITGGSDKSGVPLRAGIHGGARKYILLSKGVGLRDAEKGQRFRKLIRGNLITEEIYQINCVLDGELKIDEATKATPEEKPDEKPKKDSGKS
ncbi:MAG TPA: S6e family ribosomal protein [Nitrosopumilaceae archaeon]|nr:S6e family ribosomal protein [Nitrosopumilaceae archaeon]